MRIVKLLSLLSFILIGWLLSKPVLAAMQCKGTTSRNYTTCGDYLDTSTTPHSWKCHGTGSNTSSSGCRWMYGNICASCVAVDSVCDGTTAGSCHTSGGEGTGCGGNATMQSSGCWTCDDAVCNGSYCGTSCTNQCGGALSGLSCNECGPHGSQNCGNWTQTYDCRGPATGCRECGPYGTAKCGNWTQTYDCQGAKAMCTECGPYGTPKCGNWSQTYDCKAAVPQCTECGPYGSNAGCGPWTQTYDCKASQSGCNECQNCALHCGQAKSCGGNCLSDGANKPPVIPGALVDGQPAGNSVATASVLNGVNTAALSWPAAGGTTTGYQLVLLNAVGTTMASYNQPLSLTTNFTTPALAVGWYRFHIRSVNNTCNGSPAGVSYGDWSDVSSGNWYYFRINTAPTFVSLTIKNADGTVVPMENTGIGSSGNQICQSNFTSSVNPNHRLVTFDALFRDIDGCADIGVGASGVLQWNGASYVLTPGACQGATDRLFSLTVDYTGYNSPNLAQIQANITDIYSATNGFVNTTRNWKVWNCQVPVSGTINDGSPNPMCSTVSAGFGFNNPDTGSMHFTQLTYTTGGVSTPMTVVQPATYGPNSLTWGNSYTLAFNADLLASGQVMRTIDLGVGTTFCNALTLNLNQANVNAYANAPSVQADFSFIKFQEAWWQASRGGVMAGAGGRIDSMVPVTCSMPGCNPSMIVSGVGVSDDGLAAAPTIQSISGCTLGVQCNYTSPRNTYLPGNTLKNKISYQDVYNNYFGKYGMGTTLVAGINVGQLISKTGGTGVALVNGDLDIDANLPALPSGSFLMVVAKGQITVEGNVTNMDGIFQADGNINIGGSNATPLNINGSLYSLGNIKMTRTLGDTEANKILNNTAPATRVNYRPDFIFNLPPQLVEAFNAKY